MRLVTVSVVLGVVLLAGVPAQAENTGVAVGSSRLIVDLDYSDTFTGTDAGGMAGRSWGVYPVPAEGLPVENCYGNPQRQWPEAYWSINSDDNALPGNTPWPGGNGAGSETGMTQTGGSGNDWSIAYGLRTDFVVQVDGVQCDDRFDIWISASGVDTFFDAQALAVFFRGSDYAGSWGKIGIFHNGEYDSGLKSTAPIGEWHNFAVHFMLDDNKIEIFTDETSLGMVDLKELLPDTDFSNAVIGCGYYGESSDRMWTDNFQVGSRVGATKASKPYPTDGSDDVLRDIVLSWTPGASADAHDVYFGTDLDKVTDAAREKPQDVLASQAQDLSSYNPQAPLQFGQTYYWRVDEVTGNTIYKGSVWSFTVEPYSIPIEGVQATASSQDSDASGPEKTVDGSGLNDADQHSTEEGTMWRSAAGDVSPWIQFEFDKAYKLDRMLVWNSNGDTEALAGLGVKDVNIVVSTDGATWTPVEGVPAFAQTTGQDGYEANTVVQFGNVMAKMVRINVESNQAGLVAAYGLSEVRFFAIPTYAREPEPAAGDIASGIEVELSWRAGREAVSHEVYLGTDANDLTLVDTVAGNTYTLSSLLYGTTYYWSVTEVNDAGTPASYAGDVWSFSTLAYSVVDDFEAYNDEEGLGTRIYESWIDGWGTTNNGAIAGHEDVPFAEKTIVYAGKQSLPLSYDNSSAPLSEATLSFNASDWTIRGIQTLSLMFHGATGNTGQLYIKINSTKIAYDGDAADIARAEWQAWNIDLATVNADLQDVTSLTVGVDGAGAKGLLYVDAICLYPQVGELISPVEPTPEGLIAHIEFEGNVNDSSGQGNHGTALDSPTYGPGVDGQAIDLNGWSQAVRIAHSPTLKPESAITISAWVKPDDITFNRWCEIYRKEDGSARHLLSFQEWGTILSLGLGVNGRYAELDTPINPSDYTDGEWHLVTATYDGSHKRVYADGGLLGVAAASGPIMTTGSASGYIGSSDGSSEFLDAQIDDFRLYSRALSLGEILWLAGRTTPVHKPF
ncbi:MAG: discoidin domain-containing protein [Phycisphaerae bacterium]|nr:discoidin domain-containing protein [Phycisphaerae bacterium]